MNREIKVRGIDAITGHWAYGFYYPSKGHAIIRDEKNNECIVLAKTVGEITEPLPGKVYFEGDILSERWKVEIFKEKATGCFMVRFHTNPIGNKIRPLHEYLKKRIKAGCPEDCEVIGNIYEHSYLLK